MSTLPSRTVQAFAATTFGAACFLGVPFVAAVLLSR